MIQHTLPLAIFVPLCLAACGGQPDNAPGPGGVTVGKAPAIDEAAATPDAQAAPTNQSNASTAAEAR
ncbi:hypothetical protein ACMT1E_04705 [Sphingomonas flavalba]|uniref:hypothetical protein n=1 Tax=Sphingomonas flavalba TaxID=2559804 RepID=UPI0039E11976